MGRHTHSQRLERWLGAYNVERLSMAIRDWYGPPIALQGVPGAVFAAKGGDFVGHIEAGQFGSALDRGVDLARRQARMLRAAVARGWRISSSPHYAQLNAGFTSLSDLIAEATAGKRREFFWQKAGATGVIGVTNSLWGLGNQPAAGANASNAPGGDAPTDATTGAMPFDNVSTDTRHVVSAWATASVAGNNLLLYDRIFQVNKTMASTTNESVTGVPTRYQSSTPGAADSAEGNFLFVEVGGTALAATAHNWNALYRDNDGTDAQTLPTLTGNASAIVRRLDHPTNQWFAPLATGDTGIMDLNEIDCSASVATGVINFVIGHPLAWMTCPVANTVCLHDYIGTAFNLVRIFDDAALAWLEVMKPATTATTYNMGVTAVHG